MQRIPREEYGAVMGEMGKGGYGLALGVVEKGLPIKLLGQFRIHQGFGWQPLLVLVTSGAFGKSVQKCVLFFFFNSEPGVANDGVVLKSPPFPLYFAANGGCTPYICFLSNRTVRFHS